jgi:transposase
MKKSEELNMPIINLHAAGIDIGSREHWVSVGQFANAVKVFGTLSADNLAIIDWLKQHKITSVAMESTGNYWQVLYNELERAGFQVVLCSLRGIKNPRGKTDNKDCCWIQKLHTLGLLNASFVPSPQIETLRSYTRHRNNLVELATACSNKMQKTLRLLNIRLELVISDITGVSGLKIIKAIIDGERDAVALANLAHFGVKKTKEQIAAALLGNWREEQLFILEDLFEEYLSIQERMNRTEIKAEKVLRNMCVEIECKVLPKNISSKKRMKGQYNIDLNNLAYQYFGVDLMKIDGVSYNTVMTLIAEVGHDIVKFPSSKAFASWLRLSPHVKVSGGKVLSTKTPQNRNILSVALRNAANTIAQRKDGYLKQFFSRIAYRKGRGAAITATGRKLAIIIYNMIMKKEEYNPISEIRYEQKIKQHAISNIKRTMKRLNLDQKDLEVILG